MTVVDLSALEIEFRVAETYAGVDRPRHAGRGHLRRQDVRRRSQRDLAGGARRRGHGPREAPREVPAGLRQNQRVSVRILMDRATTCSRSSAAASTRPAAAATAYVVRDGVAEQRPIKTGAVSVREIEITGGLAEGDQVVISDTDEFKNAAARDARGLTDTERPQEDKPMLEMTQVTKAYRTDLLETHALREFSLKVEQGRVRRGDRARRAPARPRSSTSPACSRRSTAGSYRLDGQDVSRLDDDARSRVRNHKIGFIFQSFNLIPDLDVFDNVDVPLRYRRMPAAERRERIHAALDLVGLSSRMKHLPSQLSGGQQQRVAIARALAGDPALLLADEPTGNLDSLMARQVMDLLEQINGMGATIVMVTHDPELARRAHRNVQVIDGQITDFKPYEPHRAPASRCCTRRRPTRRPFG